MGYHEKLDVLPATRHALALVVADDRTHRVVVTRLVQAAGYGVRSCASPADAVGFVGSHPGEVGVVLADLHLTGMSGGALCERVRRREPSAGFVLMVERTEAFGDRAAGCGDLPWLQKPVNIFELAPLLRRLLGPPAAVIGEQRRTRSSGRLPRIGDRWSRENRLEVEAAGHDVAPPAAGEHPDATLPPPAGS